MFNIVDTIICICLLIFYILCEANLRTVRNTCTPALLFFVYKLKCLFFVDKTSGVDATDNLNVSFLKISIFLKDFKF